MVEGFPVAVEGGGWIEIWIFAEHEFVVLTRSSGKLAIGGPCKGTASKVVRQDRCAACLFGGWLRAGKAAFQEFDLAVVVGFVFGDVKPLGVVVRREVTLSNQRR